MSTAVSTTVNFDLPEDRPPAEVIPIRRGRPVVVVDAALRTEILSELRALAGLGDDF